MDAVYFWNYYDTSICSKSNIKYSSTYDEGNPYRNMYVLLKPDK